MNFFRDNLYANRQRVELAGHVKYRRLQNEDNMTMKVKLKTGALFSLFNSPVPLAKYYASTAMARKRHFLLLSI